jgi:hypothetical protein
MAASDHRSPASSANDGASGTVGSIRSSSANASTRLLDLVHLGHVANFRATVPLTAQPLALSASKAWRFSLPLSRGTGGRALELRDECFATNWSARGLMTGRSLGATSERPTRSPDFVSIGIDQRTVRSRRRAARLRLVVVSDQER